ncbi:hypothetical protein [Sphingobacterium suaedae]|uniref:Uncharacterized protein n=1 Tax=Sphingobacterium suaedae TaxID=1686402 RepID=A0ABW5KFC0_9SPHI
MDWTTRRKRKGKFIVVFFAVIIGILLLVALLHYLWNLLIPEIFGFKAITYWQAFGLFILSKILFGGGFGKPRGRFRRRFPKEGCFTTEDKERLKAEWRRRFEDRCR